MVSRPSSNYDMKFLSLATLSVLLFLISVTAHSEYKAGSEPNQPAVSTRRYHTVPADFPLITVTHPAEDTAPGYLFFTSQALPWSIEGSRYAIIADDLGDVVFYRQIEDDIMANFTVQGNGMLSISTWTNKQHYLLNSTYEVVEVIRSADETRPDPHEFVVTEDNHVLLMIYKTTLIDMSQIVPGGDPTASVKYLVLQELDENRELIFEWNSLDHIPITDAVDIDLTSSNIDYIHGNSIDIDTDGNWIVSSRNTNQIIKINRSNGEVMWRMGGSSNEFKLLNDDKWFSRQHDARRLPNGNISVFDNFWGQEGESRYAEYYVEEDVKILWLVREYINPIRLHVHSMGNAQYLPDGGVLIGWGSREPRPDAPAITEIGPSNEKRLELILQSSIDESQKVAVYRAYRHEWHGFPEKPVAVLVGGTDGAFQIFYSANGLTKAEDGRYEWRVICQRGGINQVVDVQTHVQFEQSTLLSGANLECDAYRVELISPNLSARLSSEWVELEKLFIPLVSP